MEMPTLHRVEYYNFLSVVYSLTTIPEVRTALVESVSHSDMTFGTNAFTLVRAGDLSEVWYNDPNQVFAAEKLEHWYSPETLINLEG